MDEWESEHGLTAAIGQVENDLSPNGVPVAPMIDRPEDAWTWVVHYDDGTADAEADGCSWHNVILDRVVLVQLLPRDPNGLMFGIKREAADKSRPVFIRRRYTPWVIQGGEWTSLHCLGLEWPDGHGAYTFWDDVGHVVITSDKNGL